MNIIRTCKKHGDLTIDQCFIRIEKRWGIQPNHKYSCKLCKKDSMDKYISKESNKEKKRIYERAFKRDNRDKILPVRRAYAEKNKERIKLREQERQRKNPERSKELNRNIQKKWRDELHDNYIKAQLKSRKYKKFMKRSEIPQEIVELKRAVILLSRSIKKIKDEDSI